MPGRQFNSDSYRYGFNGKENDNEVKGITGSQQDYGLRIYDPRLGKFLSVDPLGSAYPWNSSYALAENDIIRCIDLDGGEKEVKSFYPASGSAQLSNIGAGDLDWIVAKDFVTINHLPDNGTFQIFHLKNKTYATYSFAIDGRGFTAEIGENYIIAAYNLAEEKRHTSREFYGKITEGVSLVGNLFTGEVLLPEVLPRENSCSSTIPKSEEKLVDIELKMKPGWTAAQKAAAIEKAEALTKAETFVVKAPERMPKTRGRFKEAGGIVDESEDVDHTIDLQLGGADEVWNMKGLDMSVNRSMGRQIQNQIKDLPTGTKIGKVTIVE